MIRNAITILSLSLMVGCSVASRLHRSEANVSLSQLSKQQREEQAAPKEQKIITEQSKGPQLMLAEMVDGELLSTLNIEQVTVVSKMRTIPERNGEITLDFVVTIPKEVLGSSRNVTITPKLHEPSGTRSLEDLTIRGALIDKIQQRDYWQYRSYVERFSPSEERAEQMFNRFVKFPRPTDARLDSLVENRSHIVYYYSQRLKTDETTKRLKITLEGGVEGVDNTIYLLPPSDTLSYTVSSMLSFIDLTPRFKIKVIDKYITVSDRNFIGFPLGRSTIIDTLGDNRKELDKITRLMETIIKQEEFHVDTITLTAASSPEGNFRLNERLSEQRAYALRNHLTQRFGKEVSDIFSVKWVAEDWVELRELISQSEEVKNKAAILKIIEEQKSLDVREQSIKTRFASDYAYISKELYPKLRSVNFRYNLRRKGMVKDTIQTTELDTLYARGVKLLQQRKYPQALYILNSYKDRNAIVAHLSLGHDKEALELLEKQPKDATAHYLSAIAMSRLGMRSDALSEYQRACELEPRMVFRANLDIEISELLKNKKR